MRKPKKVPRPSWGIYSAPQAVEWILKIEKARGDRTKIKPYRFKTTEDKKFMRSTMTCEKRVRWKYMTVYNIQTVSEDSPSESGRVHYWWDNHINELKPLAGLLELL